LLITNFGSLNIGCSTPGRLFFLLVDDVPLRSSVFYKDDGTDLSGTLTGTTADVIPAGDHEIALGAQCYAPTTFLGTSSYTGFSSSSVTVIP
jgi:hypothetical protein